MTLGQFGAGANSARSRGQSRTAIESIVDPTRY